MRVIEIAKIIQILNNIIFNQYITFKVKNLFLKKQIFIVDNVIAKI